MGKWNHKVSFTHSRHEWCNLTNFYHTFFLLMSLLENATSPWGQSWERVLHKHKCIQITALVIFFSIWQSLTWIESEMNFSLKSVSDLNWKNIARPKSYLFFWVIWSIKVSKNANFQNYFVASVFLVTLYQTHQNIHPLQYSVFEI